MTPERGLDELTRDLEDAAAALRGGDLDPAAAAELIERCAELSSEVGRALERAGRDAELDTPEDDAQEQLL